ncbi:hypothetical protein ACOS9K_27710, partial [Klebsiella pneumoniae]
LIRLLILGSGYNTMISHLGLIRTFLNVHLPETEGTYETTLSEPSGFYILLLTYSVKRLLFRT